MSLPSCQCGEPGFAFDAGTNPETVDVLGTVIVLKAGGPSRAWCPGHWPWMSATKQEFERTA